MELSLRGSMTRAFTFGLAFATQTNFSPPIFIYLFLFSFQVASHYEKMRHSFRLLRLRSLSLTLSGFSLKVCTAPAGLSSLCRTS